MKKRWSARYGLVIGATTVDWGDVQPDRKAVGVVINEQTKWVIDIYDNAMFYMTVQDFIRMAPAAFKPQRNWTAMAASLKASIRKHLSNAQENKYYPHIYLNGSPFSSSFNENQLLYTGGSACAVLARLHSPAEVKSINQQLLVQPPQDRHCPVAPQCPIMVIKLWLSDTLPKVNRSPKG